MLHLEKYDLFKKKDYINKIYVDETILSIHLYFIEKSIDKNIFLSMRVDIQGYFSSAFTTIDENRVGFYRETLLTMSKINENKNNLITISQFIDKYPDITLFLWKRVNKNKERHENKILYDFLSKEEDKIELMIQANKYNL